jgi:hypothetical protein
MKQSDSVREYVLARLSDLDKQKDLQDLIWKGKFSFGIDSTIYGDLPAWQDVIKKKKRLVRWVWLDALFLSLLISGTTTDIWDKFADHWARALLGLVLITGVVMLFFVITAYYNLFVQFRHVEREIRKLIYQDLLRRIEEAERPG